jgi:protein TonB
MFEHYTEAKTAKLPKWVRLILIASVVLHGLALLAFIIHGWWSIEKLALPKEGVAIAVSAPPPAPPPAKKGSRNPKKKKTNTKKVIKKKPSEMTQSVKLDKPIETAAPDIDSEEYGDPNGSENGVAWSTCTGPACDPNSPLVNAPPPPPPEPVKKEEPKIVPQVALEQQRIAGNKHVVPSDSDKLAIKRAGQSRVVTTVKMCLSSGGTVNRVDMLKSSGYPAYDQKIKSTMRTWKYKPFRVNGKAVPVCTSVTFIYNQKN